MGNRLTWNAISGAAFYKINISGVKQINNIRYQPQGCAYYTKRTSAKLSEMQPNNHRGISYQEGLADPAFLIGDILVADKHTITVAAFDDEGN